MSHQLERTLTLSGDGVEKEAVWGKFAQVHQAPFSPQWPVYSEVPQVQQGRALCPRLQEFCNTNVANTSLREKYIWLALKSTRGNGCFECGGPGHFREDLPKLKIRMEEMESAQGWVSAVGNAGEERECTRDLTPMSSWFNHTIEL
ncbi:hypothetical protein Tco_0373122 [Tanacetum coccineum]